MKVYNTSSSAVSVRYDENHDQDDTPQDLVSCELAHGDYCEVPDGVAEQLLSRPGFDENPAAVPMGAATAPPPTEPPESTDPTEPPADQVGDETPEA